MNYFRCHLHNFSLLRPLLSVLRKQKQWYCFRFCTDFCLLSRPEKQKQISKLSLDDDLNNSGSCFCTATNRTKPICQQTLFQHSLDNLLLGLTRLRPAQEEHDSFRKLSLVSLRTLNISRRSIADDDAVNQLYHAIAKGYNIRF